MAGVGWFPPSSEISLPADKYVHKRYTRCECVSHGVGIVLTAPLQHLERPRALHGALEYEA